MIFRKLRKDGDGYWDGWIGVHGVGYSDNVILYREHLQSGNGTSGDDERVDEQVGVHVVHPEDPGAYLDNSPGSSVKRHSNVHLGELHWDSDPTDPNPEQLDEKTSLEIEVDWLTGHNPSQIRRGGETVLSSTKKNLALYGINVTFDESNSDSIEKSELQDLVKGHKRKLLFPGSTITVPVPIYVTPDSLNVKELSVIENEYHDDDSKLHLLYANEYGSDEPEYIPHDKFIPGNVIGLEGHTGSPGQVAALETTGRVPYGTVVFDNETSSFSEAKKLLMHELGHALSIGWLDDKGDGHIAECYSGSDCVKGSIAGVKLVGGGEDETPEYVTSLTPTRADWSIMTDGYDAEMLSHERLLYSIEELLTVDTEEVPSRDD